MTAGALLGVLPVDKPEGPTSHDVVAAARRALGERRIGHTGTLDPFASGLMLLCVGAATRLAEFLTGMDKGYEAVVRLGVATDSGDRDGEVTRATEAWRDVTGEDVERALSGLRGTIVQRPPSLSAKKVEGVAAHRRVRRGEAVELPPQQVTVHELRVEAFAPPELRVAVRCSSGTYVRALARDLGDALGVGAHLTALRRTSVGAFDLTGALAPEDLSDRGRVAAALLSPLEAVAHLPRLDVPPPAVDDLGHGRSVEADALPDGETVVAAAAGRLVAVGAVRQGRFRPRKVFAP